MKVYTPPLGKCTACNEYIGRPSTGEDEKNQTEPGQTFPSQYYCPVCSDSTDWTRLNHNDLNDEIENNHGTTILSDELRHSADDDLDWKVWKPDYKKDDS